MPVDHENLLSALIDREPVDARELLAALERPQAIDVLRDLVALRVGTTDDARPSDDFYRRMRHELAGRESAPWWRSLLPVPAAALLAFVALAAFWGGLEWGRPQQDSPPKPDREIRFVVGQDWQEENQS